MSAEEAWGWTVLMCETINDCTPRCLESGAMVPPFTVPDHINLDGGAVFFPGTYDAGESQGGPRWGLLPPHDNQYWLTFTAHAAMVLGEDDCMGSRSVRTPAGNMPLYQACWLTHHALDVSPETGCCLTHPGRHQVDWGYNDSVRKHGQLLFPSLLRIESCHKLARICEGCSQPGMASAVRAEATQFLTSIEAVFVESRDDHVWLVSATGQGRLPDVWGTAFALHRGYVDDALAEELCRSLLQSFELGTAVQAGQVSHLDTRYGFWPEIGGEGHYQNGAYWGYPVGWYVNALSRIDPQAARRLFLDYLASMERNWRPDGIGCGYECINESIGWAKNPGYLTTVALPYVALLEAEVLANTDGMPGAEP